MSTAHLGPPHSSTTKQKAIEDAKRTQSSIVRDCSDAGKEPPPYVLTELIGKGSFGRVYKATASETNNSGRLFAVKIISIEDGDMHQPGAADTFGDILKEVNTLKLLRSSGAKNINNIVDTLLVGQSVWMVTEYCAGGSVSSLMRPTGGLPERWIVPILREVAEALCWVHQQGIIHRDVKCANVLVTEVGHVQLCDFGVAGIVETKFDKRHTVTGTLQWMAPELFDPTVSYGIEVDIWAFGAMAYEIASGLPPNAITKPIHVSEFGSYLKAHCPRLQGDQYSEHLKDLVAFCMVEDPLQRPPIAQVQQHSFLYDTCLEYPTASLAKLVEAYQVWEARGGSRQSLFTAGGAQWLDDDDPDSIPDGGWNFETARDSDNQAFFAHDQQDAAVKVHDVYGPDIDFPTPRAAPKPLRRRRKPPKMKEFKVPLQKVFDPNTLSKYEDNARVFYGRTATAPPSDLPLRDDTWKPPVRESLIDLDLSSSGRGDAAPPPTDVDVETIRYRPRSSEGASFDRRRTQDWSFPAMAPASAGPGAVPFSFPSRADDVFDEPHITSAPSLIDLDQSINGFPSEPSAGKALPGSVSRVSTASLIDLDASFTATPPHPRTASDTASVDWETGSAPFSLDTPATMYLSTPDWEPDDTEIYNWIEPSLYASDGLGELATAAAAAEARLGGSDALSSYYGPLLTQDRDAHPRETQRRLPSVPPPPSDKVMQGLASADEVEDELRRMIASLGEHFQACSDSLKDLSPHGTDQRERRNPP